MSLLTQETGQSGFLRSFHFSGLANGLVNELLGKVERPSWLLFTFRMAPDVAARRMVFTINVQISPHMRRVRLRDGAEPLLVGTKHGRRFHAELGLPDTTVREAPKEVPRLVRDAFKASLLSDAYRFYEFDPRIGWRWDGKEDFELLKSALFDPRGPMSRSGVPLILRRDGSEPGYSPQEVHEPRCPFCREAHTFDDPPLWAGGNLLWVHARCWRRT